jgi:hypothetical protein
MLVDLSHVKSGFSDKLRVVTFFIALKKLLKLNFFLNVYEKKNFQCPFRFIDFCKVKNFRLTKIKYISNKIRDNNIIMNSYNSEINITNCKKHNLFNNINNYKLLDKWKLSYKDIVPNSALKKKIKKINLPKKFVSVHIRSTDRIIKFNRIILDLQLKDMFFNFQLKKFEENLNDLIKKNTSIKSIYIASDEEEFRKKIIENLKKKNYKVYYNECMYSNSKFRKTSGEDFLIDLFCLSASKIIFTTIGGGVPYAAQLLSNKKTKIINWVNQINIFIFLRIIVYFIYYLKRLKFRLFS